ncbi:MAG: DUF6491 family protein [Gammaproteobacteria bacterium]|jgi:hypothetical protein|nr:DUF6491 family protein [Gammaproteobacteria bacterium]MDP6616655.1 DUF6491 family protein [Gammaproteobacteria bacterium]MDP6694985.1 DUF6491 family protein [Gammaproteobacteria bacterium]
MKTSAYLLLLVALLVPVSAVYADDDTDDSDNSDDTKPKAETISTEGLKTGCFYVRDVNNWVAVNRTQLIIYAPTKRRAYLLTIAPPSASRHFGSTIAFAGRDRICGRPGERLLTGSRLDQRHMVMDVRRMDEDAVLAYEATRKARDKDVKAEESPGAEVETDIE